MHYKQGSCKESEENALSCKILKKLIQDLCKILEDSCKTFARSWMILARSLQRKQILLTRDALSNERYFQQR